MKIAIISKSGRKGGGASRCAEDLYNCFNNLSFVVNHFARSNDNDTIIPLYKDFEKKIYHRLMDIGFQEIVPFEKKVLLKYDNQVKYDIFHFHDISSAVTPHTIKYLSKKNKNIIWTLHDCTAFTGGCVYPLECQKYKNICYACPQIGNFPLARNVDLTFLFQYLKKDLHKKTNIHYVAPSKWMADFAYNSGLLKQYPTIISNGVDTNLFKAYNKSEIRKKLNLPDNRFIILLSASGLNNPYKGINHAIETILMLKEINPFILMIGTPDKIITEKLAQFDTFETGYIMDKAILNQYYASADIFLNTTIADNQPIAVLESMASGTPIVGFDTGGLPEMITQNNDGFLVKSKDITQLYSKVLQIYTNQEYIQMGINARRKIETSHSMELFYQKHFELYKSIVKVQQS